MKMAVVGCEASGKTVFMCALADYYGRAAADKPTRLKLTPENAAANSFERYQFRQMRCLRQWPPATPPNRTIEVKWALRRDGEPVAAIEMLEFGGETFRAAFRETPNPDRSKQEASVRELTEYLSGADFFVVLVSIKSLLLDAAKASEDDYERETEALWVTRGILEFIRKNRPNAGVVIGLTQADRYRNELGEAGGAQKLFNSRWPTIAAAANGYPVVEVASVSKTDENGNPAQNYHTNGVVPVMQAFARHCFGDENALENGSSIKTRKPGSSRTKTYVRTAIAAVLLGVLAAGAIVFWRHGGIDRLRHWRSAAPAASEPIIVERTFTNTVVQTVRETVTNEVEVLIDRPVTNTVELIVEKQVTNTVELIVEKQVTNTVERIVERPVTNTVELIVERPVTNTIERIIERQVTNTVERIVEVEAVSDDDDNDPSTNDYRTWTDHNGRKIVAKWLEINSTQDGITIIDRNGKRIEAVVRKFSQADRAYIKSEMVRRTELGEVLSDGKWVHNPMLK